MAKNKKNAPTPQAKPKTATPQPPKTIVMRDRLAFFKENALALALLSVLAIGLYISTVGFDYALDD